MAQTEGFWFVCRSRFDGPLSKRVRRIEAPSILTWFQWQIDDARTSAAPGKVAEKALGGSVRDLARLFEATKDKVLHTPRSSTALRKMLREHLRGGADVETVAVDDHSVRVRCQEDDPSYAYYFFDDEAVREAPSQFAWLLHDSAQLPDGESPSQLALPGGVPSLKPAGTSSGQGLFACFFATHRKPALPGKAVRIEGVSLPELAQYLQRSSPEAGSDGAVWPVELRLLRALTEPGDATVGAALGRVSAFSLAGLPAEDAAALGMGAPADAETELLEAARSVPFAGDPAKSVVGEGAHAAWMFAHVSDELGFEQWMLFDDVWAASQADLATSLLRCAASWDPCAKLKAARPPKPASTPKAPKQRTAAPRREQGERPAPELAARLRAPRTVAETRDRAAWTESLAGRTESEAIPYRPTLRFGVGEVVLHAKFGLGVVSRVELSNCEVLFADGPRLLAHCLGV